MIEVVMSIAFLVCLIAFVIGCLDCLFKKKRFEALGIRDVVHARQNAAFSVDIFDAASGTDQVIIEPLPDILSKVSPVPVLRPRITYTERGKQEATLSLHNVQRSFPRDHLTYLNEIGSGWYGKAILSEAVSIVGGASRSRVVVKMLKDDASKLEQKQFMEEVLAFRCLEHANLMSLLGQCTETTPYLVILEFAVHGNLKNYLIQHRQDVDALIESNRLVQFALDAASGLACLHRHEYVHNDLAARNCLIMADHTLKIGDYGTSDHLFKDEYFNTGTELLPVRWMAPETLTQVGGVWTSQNSGKISDMWSFGILLWEICSLGERPYDLLTDESVLQGVVLDRLVLPSDIQAKLPFKVKMWSVMIQCWQEPSQRMNVEQTHHILEQMNKSQVDAFHAISDFDHKWNHLEPKQGKVTSVDSRMGKGSPSGVNFVLMAPSSPPEKPSLVKQSKTQDGDTISDFVIDLENSSTSTFMGVDISVSRTSEQSSETAAEHHLVQQDFPMHSSPYQVTLENELTGGSASADFLFPTRSLSEQTVPTVVSLSQGPSSTSQFFSPQSSPSSEYMTASETHLTPSIQGDIVTELSSSDINLSLDSEGVLFHNLIEETLQRSISHDDNRFANNNNVFSGITPVTAGVTEHYSQKSPTESDDFTDFQSAVSAADDSFLQNEREDITSMLTYNAVSSMDMPSADVFSEFVASENDENNTDNNKNECTASVSLSMAGELIDTNSKSAPVDTGYASSFCDTVAPSLVDVNSSPVRESSLLTSVLLFSGLDPEKDSRNTNIPTELSGSNKSPPVCVTQEGLEVESQATKQTTLDVLELGDTDLGAAFDDSINTFSTADSLDQSMPLNEEKPVELIPNVDNMKPKAGQKQVGISYDDSHTAESDIHIYSMMRDPTDHDANNDEVDSRISVIDMSFNNQNAPLSIVGNTNVQDDEFGQEEKPVTFGSGLYRCSHINLTEDELNVAEAEDIIEHAGGQYQEDLQSPADSDAESSNSGAQLEQVETDHKSSEQPPAQSSDDSASNQDSLPLSTSPGDFDDYALQIASEIYLSRGLKSPRVFEIPPLETIPEHQSMAGIQEDLNYTPSDTSSMDVKYEDLFGSDSYEWDDFYGDPLIGKDINLQQKAHQQNSPLRELDVSDWSMDIDSESIASSTSLMSRQSEEVSLDLSVQSEQCLPSKNDTSLDSGRSVHHFSDSELVVPNRTQNSGGLKGTLVSSLLSHIHSQKVPSSSIDQNDLYSLTEKFELETDSFSDGPSIKNLGNESPSSVSHHSSSSLPESFFTSTPPLHPAGTCTSEQHHELAVPGSHDLSKDVSDSYTTEEPDKPNEKSKLAFYPVSDELGLDSSQITDSLNGLVPAGSVEHGEQQNTNEVKLENGAVDLDLAHVVSSSHTEKENDRESQD